MKRNDSNSREQHTQTHKPLIIAHRCNGFGYKENSLPALRAALASDVSAIEIDIRLTKDSIWVVTHNPHFRNEKKQVERIHEKNYAELRTDALRLEQVLFIIARSNKELFLDVKDAGEEPQLVELLRKYKLLERTIVLSWEPFVLRKIHRIDRRVRLGFCYVPIHRLLKKIKMEVKDPLTPHKALMAFNDERTFDPASMRGYTRQHYLSTIPNIGVPLYCIGVYAPFCSTTLVNLAHKKGYKVYPFVVNTKMEYTLLKMRGVEGVITNKPRTFLPKERSLLQKITAIQTKLSTISKKKQ